MDWLQFDFVPRLKRSGFFRFSVPSTTTEYLLVHTFIDPRFYEEMWVKYWRVRALYCLCRKVRWESVSVDILPSSPREPGFFFNFCVASESRPKARATLQWTRQGPVDSSAIGWSFYNWNNCLLRFVFRVPCGLFLCSRQRFLFSSPSVRLFFSLRNLCDEKLSAGVMQRSRFASAGEKKLWKISKSRCQLKMPLIYFSHVISVSRVRKYLRVFFLLPALARVRDCKLQGLINMPGFLTCLAVSRETRGGKIVELRLAGLRRGKSFHVTEYWLTENVSKTTTKLLTFQFVCRSFLTSTKRQYMISL